jgi:hypothetical protein
VCFGIVLNKEVASTFIKQRRTERMKPKKLRLNMKFLDKYFKILKLIKFDNSLRDCYVADFVLFCHDADRSLLKDERVYSPIADSFAQDLTKIGFSILQISLPYSEIKQNQTWANALKLNRYFLFFHFFDYLFNLVFYKNISFFRSLFYILIFKLVKPKSVIAIGATHEMCIASKVCKIKLVEIAHGMGITPIPWGWDKRSLRELPDGIICFDNVSSKTFLSLNCVHVVTMMHPFVKYFLSARTKSSLPCEWKVKKIHSGYDKEILVTLSWGYAGEYGKKSCFDGILPNKICYESLLDAIECTKGKILWRLRLHPVHLRSSRYFWVVNFVANIAKKFSNVEWEESSRLPLLSILAKCKGHISMLSTSAYEAAYLGVSSLLLCPTLRNGREYSEMFLDLENLGYVKKSSADLQEILSWVNTIELKKPIQGDEKFNSNFCEVINWMIS